MIRAKSVDLESEQQSGIAVTIDFSLHNENDQKKQQQTDSTNQGIQTLLRHDFSINLETSNSLNFVVSEKSAY